MHLYTICVVRKYHLKQKIKNQEIYYYFISTTKFYILKTFIEEKTFTAIFEISGRMNNKMN